eukprot:100472_1
MILKLDKPEFIKHLRSFIYINNKLNINQNSLLNISQLLEYEFNDILNISKVALKFCKWENMFINDVINGYKTNKIKQLSAPTRNLTLICHDMAGGYHNDSYVFGNHIYKNHENELPFEYFIDGYWSLIDIFVYFSHDFITIPPIQWIEQCHENNVLILGTLITEHKYGIELNHLIIDNKLIRNEIINKLINIAIYYGFDGWFLNFESELKNIESINNLLLFVKQLTNELHKYIPYGKIIWYDSVSCKNGKIEWQSRLNEHGLPFFNVCDGFFTDYHWKKEYPKESIKYASKTNREYAVFTGIDIWGRGTWGNGAYNTGNIVNYLLNEINCSIGLFGTAWTFEHEIYVDNNIRKSLNDNYCNDYNVKLFKMNEKYFWHGEKYFIYKCNKQNEWNANNIKQRGGWEIDNENKYWIASFQWCIRSININLNKIFNINLNNYNKYKIIIK